MSVEALLTNNRNRTFYHPHSNASFKNESQAVRWSFEIASELANSKKEEEDTCKNTTVRLGNPLLNSHHPTFRTETLTTSCPESEEIIHSYQQQNELSVSEEQINLLFEDQDAAYENVIEYTKSIFTSNYSNEPDTVFFTYYSSESIKCIREGERNPQNPEEKIGKDELYWEIKLDSKEQYDEIMQFLSQFPQEDNFRFTMNQDFWNDFLDEKVDMDSFMNFYAWTNHGVPNMGKGENGEQVGLNKARINDPNAKYFNDLFWIAHIWTEEEMWAEWYAKIEASSAAQKASGVDKPALKYHRETTYTNAYFKLADEMGIINYNGTKFTCDYKTNTLKLGECGNLKNCIQIALTGGGSLIVNKDNIDELINAISMFSPEDVACILRTIQKERMIQKAISDTEEIASEVLEDSDTSITTFN